MFERILAMDSWKTFCLPFLSKCYWPGFLLVENSVQYNLLTLKIHKLIVQYKLKLKLNFLFFRFDGTSWDKYILNHMAAQKNMIKDICYCSPLCIKEQNQPIMVTLCSLLHFTSLKDIEQINCQFVDAFYVPLASASGMV